MSNYRRHADVRPPKSGLAVMFTIWVFLLACFIFWAVDAQAATIERYDNTSYLSRALLECEIPETVNDGWCDTEVDAPTEFRGELYWSSWGATLSVHVCWLGTDQGCLDTQLELLFRFVQVGSNNVTTFIRSFDLYNTAGPDLYHHILYWTNDDQQIVGTLPNGQRYILVFRGARDKAYLWSD